MTTLPGRRPVVCLYLDPSAALLPDGSMAKFWGRFLVAFTRTFDQRHYSTILDMADAPDPGAVVEAQGYVVAGTRPQAGRAADDVAFGQLLVAPGVGSSDPYLPSIDFEHDYDRMADECLALLPGIERVLLVPRSGQHMYVERFTNALASRVPVERTPIDEVRDSPRVAVVSFSDDLAAVRGMLAALPPTVPVVLQTEAFESGRPLIFLDLLGAECGTLIANAVADALSGGDGGTVLLPYQWVA